MKETFGLALLIEGGYNSDFKTRLHEHLPNLNDNFDHFNVRNHIYLVLTNFFADKLKKKAIEVNPVQYSSFTQSLVDPVILKQGHLDPDAGELEMKDLIILLRNLPDHGPKILEVIANEYLALHSKVTNLDELFKSADQNGD